MTGDIGSRRTATWTLKVPVDQFRAVLAALAALGHPVRNSSDSQDVTEEFVDLQARVKNFKVEEETLNKLLKESAVKIEDILKIREQIKNVRGDIERAEGRMKYLSTMAAMSTVTMTAREDMTYVPPLPETAPTFGDEIEGTFSRSVNALKNTGQQLTLVAVGLAPWSPFILIGLLFFRWAIKKLIASGNTPATHRSPREPRRSRSDADPAPVALPLAHPPAHPEPEKPAGGEGG